MSAYSSIISLNKDCFEFYLAVEACFDPTVMVVKNNKITLVCISMHALTAFKYSLKFDHLRFSMTWSCGERDETLRFALSCKLLKDNFAWRAMHASPLHQTEKPNLIPTFNTLSISYLISISEAVSPQKKSDISIALPLYLNISR